MKKLIAAVMIAGTSLVATNCYGSFAATRLIYKVNGKIGPEPVKTIVMWAFAIIPVYGVAGLLDLFILNPLEFFTGSNPLAQGDKNVTTYLAKTNKGDLLITEKNNLILVAKREKPEEVILTLVYDAVDQSWNAVTPDGQIKKVAGFNPDKPESLMLFTAEGNAVAAPRS